MPQLATWSFARASVCQPARVCDQARRAADDPPGGGGHAPELADVGDVLAVGHHHERRAGGDRREPTRGPGGEEDVGEDHVGPPPHGMGQRPRGQPRVFGPRGAAMIDRHDVHLVAQRLQLADDGDQEAAEVRVVGPGPHLGAEQDAHPRDYRWRMETGFSRARIDPDPGERFVSLRRELGVTSFGLNELALEPGQRGRIHRHREQEEVYLVLEGTLTLLVEGEEHALGRGELARVGPELRRQLVNRGPERLILLALGGSGEHAGRDGLAYPDWDTPAEKGRPPQEVPLPDALES
jgi:uncharacterized cupin superfamily protein